MKRDAAAMTCMWQLCHERAVKDRWDPFFAAYRAACARHAAMATPFELRPLTKDEPT